jgi:hypothetical protein
MKSQLNIYILTIGVLVSPVTHLRAEFIISPTTPNDGNGNYGAFFIPARLAPSVRYQELRSASDFSSFGSPLLITEFSLWRHPLSLPIDFTLPNVAVHFSTTTRSPVEISRVFAENIGANETTVLSGPLHLVDTGGEYGIRIPLQTPFLYDPSQGNLLMDFWNYQTVSTPENAQYSAYFASTFAISIWFTAAGDAAAVRGTTASTGGLFTRFTVTPVPEPSTWLLLAAAVATLAFARRISNRTR